MSVHGQFHWNELMTRDTDKAKAFYAACVGWTFDEVSLDDGPSYWVAMAAGGPVAGMYIIQGPQFEGVPDHWMGYLHVDDIDAAVEKAKANGATITRPPFDVPTVGRIAIIQEPGGAMIGWMTPVEWR